MGAALDAFNARPEAGFLESFGDFLRAQILQQRAERRVETAVIHHGLAQGRGSGTILSAPFSHLFTHPGKRGAVVGTSTGIDPAIRLGQTNDNVPNRSL